MGPLVRTPPPSYFLFGYGGFWFFLFFLSFRDLRFDIAEEVGVQDEGEGRVSGSVMHGLWDSCPLSRISFVVI